MDIVSRAIAISLALCLSAATAVAGSGQTRPADDDGELRRWLESMVWRHRYSTAEIEDVTGLSSEQLKSKLKEFGISDQTRPAREAGRSLLLPYPGGRHPRIGFLDGAVEPQRETKLSAFCPWDEISYAVLDTPEAIWSNLGLIYLAHTHVDTIWTRQNVALPRIEWEPLDDGGYRMRRRLPNGIAFGVRVTPVRQDDPRGDHLRMSMWLTNGTQAPLTDLRVQNCVMLKGAAGFTQIDGSHKLFRQGYAAAESEAGGRWIITAWEPVDRTWGNAPCPCLHSDPKFPDCAPGETVRLRGWFSFYTGEDIDEELNRIEATGWREAELETEDAQSVPKGTALPCKPEPAAPRRP